MSSNEAPPVEGAKGIPQIHAILIDKPVLEEFGIGSVRGTIESSEVIFEANFTSTLEGKLSRVGKGKALCLANFRSLGSAVERDIFDAATRDIASIARSVHDIRVSSAETGAAWALGLRAYIFRELYAVYALEEIFNRAPKTITVVFDRIGAVENALLARLHSYDQATRIKFTGLSQLQGGKLIKVESEEVQALMQGVHTEDERVISPFANEILEGDPNVFEGGDPSPADVLFLHLTGNRMFLKDIPPILSSLANNGNSAAALAMTDKELEIYDVIKEHTPNNIVKLKKGLRPTSAEQVMRILQAIRDRVNNLTAQDSPLQSLSPVLAVNDNRYMRSTLSRLMVFHNAYHALLDSAKPKALYVSQSPDTNPMAYLALSIGRARVTPYYSFSSFVTEDARSVPFIAPAHLLAYGEHDREAISRRNAKAGGAAVVTGMPSLDYIVGEDNESLRQTLIDKMALDADKPIITIKTSRLNPKAEDVWIAPFIRWTDTQDVSVILAENSRAGTKSFHDLLKMANAKGWKNIFHVETIRDANLALSGSHIVISDQPENVLPGLIAARVFVHVKIGEDREETLGEGTGFTARTGYELRDIVSGVLLDADYVPKALTEHRKRLQKLLNQEEVGMAADRVVKALMGDREPTEFDSPFTEPRLISSDSPKLAVVPRVIIS